MSQKGEFLSFSSPDLLVQLDDSSHLSSGINEAEQPCEMSNITKAPPGDKMDKSAGELSENPGSSEIFREKSSHPSTADKKPQKWGGPQNLFNWKKKDQQATTYTQPVKVDQIQADPDADNPMDFLIKLLRNNGRNKRGYIAHVDPLPFDAPKPPNHTRFVCISDTHNSHGDLTLPDGDVLLHCGDFTLSGKTHEVDNFNDWLGKVPFEHKIVIAGNHELSFDPKITDGVKKAREGRGRSRWQSQFSRFDEKDWQNISSRLTNCTYLEDDEVTIDGIRIWGSPWQPEFHGWGFNLPRGEEILEKWNKIPGDGIDILMTHGPPAGHGDKVNSGASVGCVDLLNSIQLRVQPKYHLFGHIHEAVGITTDRFTTYINCCSVDYFYRPVHKPIIFDFPNKSLTNDH